MSAAEPKRRGRPQVPFDGKRGQQKYVLQALALELARGGGSRTGAMKEIAASRGVGYSAFRQLCHYHRAEALALLQKPTEAPAVVLARLHAEMRKVQRQATKNMAEIAAALGPSAEHRAILEKIARELAPPPEFVAFFTEVDKATRGFALPRAALAGVAEQASLSDALRAHGWPFNDTLGPDFSTP